MVKKSSTGGGSKKSIHSNGKILKRGADGSISSQGPMKGKRPKFKAPKTTKRYSSKKGRAVKTRKLSRGKN